MKTRVTRSNATSNRQTSEVVPGKGKANGDLTALDLYQATRTLFRAFHYLRPRMRGGALAPPAPMNGEALAGCILHACMSRLVRQMKQTRESQAKLPDWLTKPSAGEVVSEPAR